MFQRPPSTAIWGPFPSAGLQYPLTFDPASIATPAVEITSHVLSILKHTQKHNYILIFFKINESSTLVCGFH
jgi:hypothetical protein